MTKQQKLFKIISEVLETDIAKLAPDSVFKEIENWSSLASLQIISEVEDAFNIQIPIEKMADIKTIKDLLSFVG